MNDQFFYNLTLFTTFLSLGFNLWFAIYLLSRSRANHLTFRAAVALVALAFYFNSALNELFSGDFSQSQVRSFAITIALIACHDLTHYLLPRQQRKQLYPLARSIVLFGLVMVALIFTAPPNEFCSALYVCPATMSYPAMVIDFFKVFVFGSILYNLWLIKRTEGVLPNTAFYLALLFGLGSVALGLIGTLLNTAIPRILPNLLILSSLVFLAYSVTLNRTFITSRVTTYDLPVTLITISMIVVIYIWTGQRLQLEGSGIFLIAVLAIFTHSSYDFVRDFLEQMVHRQDRQMRHELHTLRQGVAEGDSVKRYLTRGLAILCYNLQAASGFVAVRGDDQFTVVASLHSLPAGSPFPVNLVTLEKVSEPGDSFFQGIQWLAPAYAGRELVGVIGIGRRKNKVHYTEDDLFWLEDMAQEIGEVIHMNVQNKAALPPEPPVDRYLPGVDAGQPIDQGNLLAAFAYHPDSELVKAIEDGYRHLHDYYALGSSPLVSMFSIQGGDLLERGKLVHNRLVDILDKLRPVGQPSHEPLTSEWFAYTILYESYVKESLSREIMAKLYISEGTYYRVRRQALRGITRALLETGSVAPV